MARRIRSSELETRTARLRLEIRTKPHTAMIAPNIHLGYRRNADSPGSWSVKAHGWLRKFALADDYEDANGDTVLDYWQALAKAKELARIGEGSDAPVTVRQAVEDYQAELRMRGGQEYNATTLQRCHLPDALASKTVGLLRKRDLADWRAGLVKKGLKLSTVNRVSAALRSALNLAASNDTRISNGAAWREGLRPLPIPHAVEDELEAARENFILNDQTVAAIVRGAYENGAREGDHFGELIDTLAETGARASQLYKLKVRHLEDGTTPHLRMPPSRKGQHRKNARRKEPVPAPISPRLARQLRLLVGNRGADAPLFPKIRKSNDRFRPVAAKLGLDAALTVYCLRHSSIARQLLRGLPIRVVAVNHDTSAAMIEAYYNRHVASHTDALTRATLLDHDPMSAAGNVVKLTRK
jgi:integrase